MHEWGNDYTLRGNLIFIHYFSASPHHGSYVPKTKSFLSGVVVSQINGMFRANSTIIGFIVNMTSLFNKLCVQGFNKGHLVSLLSKLAIKASKSV